MVPVKVLSEDAGYLGAMRRLYADVGLLCVKGCLAFRHVDMSAYYRG